MTLDPTETLRHLDPEDAALREAGRLIGLMADDHATTSIPRCAVDTRLLGSAIADFLLDLAGVDAAPLEDVLDGSVHVLAKRSLLVSVEVAYRAARRADGALLEVTVRDGAPDFLAAGAIDRERLIVDETHPIGFLSFGDRTPNDTEAAGLGNHPAVEVRA